jgi:hypothetical protein
MLKRSPCLPSIAYRSVTHSPHRAPVRECPIGVSLDRPSTLEAALQSTPQPVIGSNQGSLVTVFPLIQPGIDDRPE